jgi:hypothetical protein
MKVGELWTWEEMVALDPSDVHGTFVVIKETQEEVLVMDSSGTTTWYYKMSVEAIAKRVTSS